MVYDETALDSYSFPTSVTVGDKDRAYVLYGHVYGHVKRGHLGGWLMRVGLRLFGFIY